MNTALRRSLNDLLIKYCERNSSWYCDEDLHGLLLTIFLTATIAYLIYLFISSWKNSKKGLGIFVKESTTEYGKEVAKEVGVNHSEVGSELKKLFKIGLITVAVSLAALVVYMLLMFMFVEA